MNAELLLAHFDRIVEAPNAVSIRTIQDRVSSGKLMARDLPGRAKVLAQDLEDFLSNSRRTTQK